MTQKNLEAMLGLMKPWQMISFEIDHTAKQGFPRRDFLMRPVGAIRPRGYRYKFIAGKGAIGGIWISGPTTPCSPQQPRRPLPTPAQSIGTALSSIMDPWIAPSARGLVHMAELGTAVDNVFVPQLLFSEPGLVLHEYHGQWCVVGALGKRGASVANALRGMRGRNQRSTSQRNSTLTQGRTAG